MIEVREEVTSVSCTICGNPTPMTGTKKCDRCWELDSKYESLLKENPGKAHDWVHAKVKELHNYRPGEANHINVSVVLTDKDKSNE